MPLSELFRLSKAKLESSQDKSSSRTTGVSSEAEDGIVELVWENGQISMQSLASKSRNTLASDDLLPHAQKTRDMGSGSDSKVETYGTMDAVRNEVPVSVPSADMSFNQDNDMVPWLNYPLDEPLQSGYCSDFFPEVSGVPVTEHMHGITSQTAFPFWHRRNSSNESITDSQSPSLRSKLSSGEAIASKITLDEAASPVGCSNHSFSSLSQHPTSRMLDDIKDRGRDAATHQAICGESGQDSTSAGCFTDDRKRQMQDTVFPHNKPGFINFSHFLHPASMAKANLENMGMTGNSGLSSTKKTGNSDHGDSASDSRAADSQLFESASALKNVKKTQFLPNLLPTRFSGPDLKAQVHSEPSSAALSFMAMSIDVSTKNDQVASQKVAESAITKDEDGAKATNVLVASSSVCSGNSLEGPSDDPTPGRKRKHSDNLDSEHSSDDIGEEPVDTKRADPAQLGSGSKRSRSAEVHNLSEMRRRDRINEKMRALQELIPNCNKVDKASMLDEAIEYLKALQLQVQMMSMGAGYYMLPMMLPTGMQHAAQIAHFPYMGGGMGIGMGFGLGMPNMNGGFPRGTVVQVPTMHGTQFPGASASPSGMASVHGAIKSRMQPFHIPSRGARAPPLTPLPAGSVLVSAVNVKDQMKNTSSGAKCPDETSSP